MAESKVEITAVDRTAAAFRAVEKRLGAFGRQIMSAQTALVGLVGAGGMGLLIKNAFDAADATAKLADRLGVATRTMTGWKHALDLAGVSEQTFATAARTMASNIADAARGTGQAAEAFGALGVSARELLRLPMDQQLELVLDRLAAVENVTLRNAYAADIFGSRASEMLNIIAEGSEGLRRATEDATAWGLAIDRVDAAKIEAANDAVTRAQKAFQGVATTIAVQLAPVISAVANGFADAAAENRGFRDEIISGMESAANAVALLGNVVQGLRFAWAGLKVLVGTALDAIIQGIAWIDRAYTAFQNKIANSFIGRKLGLEAAEVNESIQLMAEVSAERLEELKGELDAIALEGLPADRIRAMFANLRAEAEKAAQDVAAARAVALGAPVQDSVTGLAEPTDEDVKLSEANLRIEKHYRDRLEKIKESFLSENEALRLKLEEDQRIIEANFALGLINEEERKQLLEQLEIQHAEKMLGINSGFMSRLNQLWQQGARGRVEATRSMFGQLAGLMDSSSRTLFNIGKKAAIAEATLSMFTSVQNALATKPFFPVGLAMGALATAKGLANLAAIKSTNYGGGGAVSAGGGAGIGAGGATAPEPVEPVAPARSGPVINVTLAGSGRYTAQEVRDLLKQIEEEMSDGAGSGTFSFVV